MNNDINDHTMYFMIIYCIYMYTYNNKHHSYKNYNLLFNIII